MKIEAVITCVDYGDFLAETLPHNRVLFDRAVVVTAPEDKATRRVCEYWNVQCIPTDAFETRWGKFRKGCGINVGLAALAKDGWVLHMDADILCPPLTRSLLQQAELDPTQLYGFDRHICKGSDAWRSFLAMPQLQHESGAYIHLDKFPLGTRVMQGNARGYVPIGIRAVVATWGLWRGDVSGAARYCWARRRAVRDDVASGEAGADTRGRDVPPGEC